MFQLVLDSSRLGQNMMIIDHLRWSMKMALEEWANHRQMAQVKPQQKKTEFNRLFSLMTEWVSNYINLILNVLFI